MTAPRLDALAGWRAARAARVASSVATVATENDEGCNAREHDGAERQAMAPHYAAPVPAPAPPPAPPMPLPSPPRPAVPWDAMPYGAERGRAFAVARAEPGACPICAGRRWWQRAEKDEEPTCSTCHPPPPGLAVQSINAALAEQSRGKP